MIAQINNVNDWMHTLSNHNSEVRAQMRFGLYKSVLPDLWALQEVATGGASLRCLKKVESLADKNGYTVIGPRGWEPSIHPKSIQSVLLLNDKFKDIEILSLDNIELKNRFNYVRTTWGTREYYILNIHAPQIDVFKGHAANDSYIRLRKYLAKQFFDEISAEIANLIAAGKRVILCGDFTRTSSSEEIQELIKLGMCELGAPDDNDQIDHILISNTMLDEITDASYEVDEDIVELGISDHPTIILDMEF